MDVDEGKYIAAGSILQAIERITFGWQRNEKFQQIYSVSKFSSSFWGFLCVLLFYILFDENTGGQLPSTAAIIRISDMICGNFSPPNNMKRILFVWRVLIGCSYAERHVPVVSEFSCRRHHHYRCNKCSRIRGDSDEKMI